MQKSTWLSNALILPVRPARTAFAGHVLIEGERIKEIRQSDAPLPSADQDSATRVIDLQGKVLLPGFIQTHIHLCQTAFRNLAEDLDLLPWLEQKIWPAEAQHTYESLADSAAVGIAELLAGGTTTALDMGTVRHTEAVFATAAAAGIRLYSGKCLMDAPDTFAGLREDRNTAIAETEALIERWHGAADDRLRYAIAPRFALSCSEDLLRACGRIAAQKGLLLHTHSSENQTEVELVRKQTGFENIAYFEHLGLTGDNLVLAHCIWLNTAEQEILARTGTKVAHCPTTNLKLGSGIARIPELIAAGIAVGLGADGPPCNNNLNMFQEMRQAALIQKPRLGPTAMPAADVLDLATLGGAKVLGRADDLGSIEVGKLADLIVLDLQKPHSFTFDRNQDFTSLAAAIVFAASPANVAQTWVAGRPVYEAGTYTPVTAEFTERLANIFPQ